MSRILVLFMIFSGLIGLSYPGYARYAASVNPALTVNFTQSDVESKKAIETLVKYVNHVNPNAFYDVVGYETTPKNEKSPVSKRVKELEKQLISNGVSQDRIYLLIKPSEEAYQKIDIFVRN